MATILRTRIKRSLHSIRWRIVFVYLLIIVVALCAVAFSLIQLVGEALFTQRTHDDQRIAETLAEQIGQSLVALDIDAMQTIARGSLNENSGRVLIVDLSGVVQMDTQSALTGAYFPNAEIANVLAGAEQDYGYYDAGSSDHFWVRSALSFYANVRSMSGFYAHAIHADGEFAGVLVYIASVQSIYENLHGIQLKILLWMCIVAALVLIASMFVMRAITRPISELSEGIGKMTGGDLSARVSVRGQNEFSELARAFNSMSEKIEALDTSRSQFVSNASHELKTPLSTMKILIETLLYQDPVDPVMTKDFLNDVNKEIDRLNRIVSDLLTLVNIDSGGMKLNLAEMSLNALLDEQVKRLLPLARENGIEINLEMKDEIRIIGDHLKLQQVLYNVIDNAIKYTPRGGEVETALARSGKRAVIRITDTGIGIPSADLPHIFDRFYRVDKARSRATGGTGLGLSIVKQIVQQHGGAIRAKSAEGKGTCFEIELPLHLN